jgi:hypothetical protein
MARGLAQHFRNPQSAIRNLLFVLAACTPVTLRPPFAPFPEALHIIVNAPPGRAVTEAQTLLGADSAAPVVHLLSPIDGFLETKWREVRDSAGSMNVQVRVWADPDVPGKARVTVEAVYRPIADPSRTSRDLEQPCPAGSVGRKVAERLVEGLKAKLGETKY